MLRSLCCCYVLSENSDTEVSLVSSLLKTLSRKGHSAITFQRQPLLHPGPSDLNGAGSARQTRQAHNDAPTVKQMGRLVMRRLCVPELDQRFSDMAETFNEQHESYEAMVRHIRNLRQSSGCNNDDTLSLVECLDTIRDEHETRYRVSLKMKGYDFTLSVVPVGEGEEEPPPPHLQLAQNEMKGTSECAKATVSKGTTLQELVGWLLRSKDQMAERVKEAAGTYQEQGRLNENLEENLKEVRRAKQLSLGYRKLAGKVLTEAAQLAGTCL